MKRTSPVAQPPSAVRREKGTAEGGRATAKTPAAVALDLLLGVQTPSAAAERPPLMSDNLAQIRTNYEKSLADYQADRTKALSTLTTASFFGGLGLVLLVAMLGLMRIVSGLHLWVAAIGATTCCLIIGAILMDPGRSATRQDVAVAFSPYSRRLRNRTTRRKAGWDKRSDSPTTPSRGSDRVVETPFWNPLLIAGPDGKASIGFKLPDAAGAFRVTVDAHCDGRLGAGQAEIVVRDADKPPQRPLR